MNATDQLPTVSILIAMRNEEKFISKCIDSVLQTDYPVEKLEILVLDGNSNDSSRQIVDEYSKEYPFIRLVDNPQRFQAAGLNIGIKQAQGQIIVRMDAHTTYASDYVSKCVETLESSDADNAGGIQEAVGTGYITKTIAIAKTSPFGVGDAKFRYAKNKQWVDTVYLGAWFKATLVKLGGYNEDWVINEDYELNYRIRKNGGKILLNPEIKCQYYVRDSISDLATQYFKYGMWKVKTLCEHAGSLRWRQLAPPLFVAGLLFSLALLPLSGIAAAFIPTMYLLVNLMASLWTTKRQGFIYVLLLPLVFAVMHIWWGSGFVFGLTRFGVPDFSLKSLTGAFRSVAAESAKNIESGN